MPYKLRKKPNHDLYWVVNKETGKKYSKEAIPKETAKAQMRALYMNEKRGGGFFGDIWNASKIIVPALYKVASKLPSSDENARPLFEGERHSILQLPNGKTGIANFMGPGTHVIERVRRADPPRTKSDEVAKAHDIDYELASSEPTIQKQLEDVRLADKKMVDSLERIERTRSDKPFNIMLGKNLINAKMKGEDIGLISKSQFAGPLKQLEPADKALLVDARQNLAMKGLGYKITPHTLKMAKQLKVTVKPSTVKGKKIDVYEFGKKIASIGDSAYGDYGTFLKEKGKKYADMRRLLYHTRHTKKTPVELLALKLLW